MPTYMNAMPIAMNIIDNIVNIRFTFQVSQSMP